MIVRPSARLVRFIPTALAAGSFALALAACGDGAKTTASASAASTAQATSTSATKSSAATSDEMPPVTVDDMGPYINGERAKLKEAGGPEKLARVVQALPIKGKEVTLVVLKNARAPDVVAVVRELGKAGAPTVRIKHETRPDLPKELVVVPQSQLKEAAPGCSIVAMITAKLETDVWNIGGGSTGKKHVKGFAGPDLSNAGETLQRDLKKCDSKIAFFSADESLEWEVAHMIGGAIMVNDTEKKIGKLVLLDEVPVAGRPVKLAP
jgi:biopolymer transport protein ExbD